MAKSIETSKQDLERIAEKIRDLVSKDPEKAARLLTEWIHLPSKKSQPKKIA